MPLSFDRKKNTKPRKTQYTPEEMDKLRKKFKIAS